VEVGFISNPTEERQLSDPSHRHKLAVALAAAVQKYASQRK
jgi:N-acetylmuramoyl-L-alanine amidase